MQVKGIGGENLHDIAEVTQKRQIAGYHHLVIRIGDAEEQASAVNGDAYGDYCQVKYEVIFFFGHNLYGTIATGLESG
jgi:hypothetical protein